MTIDYLYDEQYGVLHVKVTGYLKICDHHMAIREIVKLGMYTDHVKIIWNINRMKFDNIDLKFLQTIVQWHQRRYFIGQNTQVAIVSNYPLGQPIVRLFLILAKELKQTFRTFISVESALDWLNSDREQVNA
jgi:hypothetical protein